MKNMIRMILVLALLAGVSVAQTAMTSTTLSAAVTATQTTFSVASATGFTASSATATYVAYVDKEAMKVVGVSGTSITVSRGAYGTRSVGHASGAVIFVGTADRYVSADMLGTCTAGSEYPNYTPLINVHNGKRFECVSSLWREVVGGIEASSLIFEGATNDAYETTITVTDPTADRTVTVPNQTGNVLLFANANSQDVNIIMEGTTADDYETTVTFTDPTADRTVTVPNAGGTVMLSSLSTNGADAANAVTGASNALLFEGATADDYETSLTVTDPTADRTITLPNETAAVMVSSLTTNATDAANSVTGASNKLVFEGATADDYETNFTPTDPTADRTVTIPNATFTLGSHTVTYAQGPTVANAVSTIFFVADRAYTVTAIKVVWGTAEATGDMDVMLEKLTGTTACASGNDLQTAIVDASTNGGGGTANTVATPALTATTADLSLAAGDRLCVTLSATPNEIKDLTATVALRVE